MKLNLFRIRHPEIVLRNGAHGRRRKGVGFVLVWNNKVG